MATTTAKAKAADTDPVAGAGTGTADLLTERIRVLNERVIRSSKDAGLVALGTYEKALQSMLTLEDKAASATQLDWIEAIANTHATFVKDLSASYTNAARDILK